MMRHQSRPIPSELTIARLIVISLTVLSFLALPAQADYSIRIQEDTVSVAISADLAQGIPNPRADITRIFGAIPTFRLTAQGDNSSLIAIPLNEAIRSKTPTALLKQTSLAVVSNGTWVHYDLSFSLDGVSSTGGIFRRIDLSWRSLTIPSDVTLRGTSLNRVLPTYLGDTIRELAELGAGGTPATRQWYINDRFRSGAQVSREYLDLTLFNFTSLARPLGEWTARYDVSRQTTRMEANTGFNLTFISRIIEDPTDPDTSFDTYRTAIYTVEASVEAPGIATVSGDALSIETSGALLGGGLMAAIVLAIAATYLCTVVVERRLHRSLPGLGRKGGRRRFRTRSK